MEKARICMVECEICGKALSLKKWAEIDGVILEVCEECSKLGREIRQPKPVMLRALSVKKPGPAIIDDEQELVNDFPAIIRKARERRNLTQDEAADKTGISRQIYRRIESGFKPDRQTAKRIERFYNIKIYKNV